MKNNTIHNFSRYILSPVLLLCRKHDIGFLQLGLNSSRAYSLTVPPNSAKYVLSSHCPGDCTKILPTSGIQVFVYLLHFHLSGNWQYQNTSLFTRHDTIVFGVHT